MEPSSPFEPPPPPPPSTPPPAPRGVWDAWGRPRLLAWAAACLLGNAAVQGAVFALTHDVFLPIALGSLLAIVLPTWLVCRAYGSSLARDFGLDRPSARVLIWTVVATAGSFTPTALLAYLSERLRPVPPEWEALFMSHLPRDPLAGAFAFLAAAFLAPLGEELVFRGIVQRLASRQWGGVAGATIAALVFALLHLEPWYLFGLIGVGLLLGYVWAVTRSLTACVVAHGLHNAAALAMMLAQAPQPASATGVERDDLILLAISLPLLGLGCWGLARAGRPARTAPPDYL